MFSSRVVRALPRSAAIHCLRPPRPQIPRKPLFSPANQVRHGSFWDKHVRSRVAIIQDTYKIHPIAVTTAIIIIISGIGFIGYLNYMYSTVIIGEFAKYPEEVAKPLRKALYFTTIDPQPQQALKHYQDALRIIHEMRLDPFTNEIIGVKLQLAFFLEKHHHHREAIDVLEIVLRDCKMWIKERGDWPGKEGQRTRVLGKCVQISIKLAELYSCDFILEPEKAEERLVWAVETAVKEENRRKEEGVKEGEDVWLSSEELGASFEALGQFYEQKDDHYLAAPLFLQAITLADPKSCHMAVLMNNLSISLAQQQPPSIPGEPPTSRSALVSNARAWSQKALEVAANVKPPERSEECDMGCAVATHNLGEFAEMDGDIVEARKKYEEAKSLAKAIGFKEGEINAQKGIERISKH